MLHLRCHGCCHHTLLTKNVHFNCVSDGAIMGINPGMILNKLHFIVRLFFYIYPRPLTPMITIFFFCVLMQQVLEVQQSIGSVHIYLVEINLSALETTCHHHQIFFSECLKALCLAPYFLPSMHLLL